MPASWQPIVFLTGVVGFWIVIFVTAIVMTRWALRGVGEITPEERADLGAPGGASANGATATTGSGAAAAGGH
jgi:hypothetical protein